MVQIVSVAEFSVWAILHLDLNLSLEFEQEQEDRFSHNFKTVVQAPQVLLAVSTMVFRGNVYTNYLQCKYEAN